MDFGERYVAGPQARLRIGLIRGEARRMECVMVWCTLAARLQDSGQHPLGATVCDVQAFQARGVANDRRRRAIADG